MHLLWCFPEQTSPELQHMPSPYPQPGMHKDCYQQHVLIIQLCTCRGDNSYKDGILFMVHVNGCELTGLNPDSTQLAHICSYAPYVWFNLLSVCIYVKGVQDAYYMYVRLLQAVFWTRDPQQAETAPPCMKLQGAPLRGKRAPS